MPKRALRNQVRLHFEILTCFGVIVRLQRLVIQESLLLLDCFLVDQILLVEL